ncbi:MAG: hypothetical protein AB7F86_02335 [Bdellovibrionales bacterium]
MAFCRIRSEDSTTIAKLAGALYVQIAPDRYVKVANSGRELTQKRLSSYRNRGVEFFYVREEDFAELVGFKIQADNAVTEAQKAQQMAVNMAVSRVVEFELNREGLEPNVMHDGCAYIEAVMQTVNQDIQIVELFQSLQTHSISTFTHCLGVGTYTTMIGSGLGPFSPSTKFALALAGTFRNIGQQELSQHLLSKPRTTWTESDWQDFELHRELGLGILQEVSSIPSETIQILTPGPNKTTHALSPIVELAEEVTLLVLGGANLPGMPAKRAAQELKNRDNPPWDAKTMTAFESILQ